MKFATFQYVTVQLTGAVMWPLTCMNGMLGLLRTPEMKRALVAMLYGTVMETLM
jgi:hypothetical protein